MIKRISIFLPKPTFIYKNLFRSIANGFKQCGLLVTGDTRHLYEEEMQAWCKEYKPDVIFEMDRTRDMIPSIPPEIKHVAWVGDTYHHFLDRFTGSEITYFFFPNNYRNFNNSNGMSDWLPPGADQSIFTYGKKNFLSDVSFIGHIPKPWTQEELDRLVSGSGMPLYSFGDLLTDYIPALASLLYKGNYIFDDFFTMANAIYKEKFGADLQVDNVLLYDIIGRTLRMFTRTKVMNAVVEATDSIRLYGPENWNLWPQYSKFYKGWVRNDNNRRDIYQTSQINFHDNITGLHFRTIDCMGSGGLLFFRTTSDDTAYGGIKTCFDEGRHYVSFSIEDFAEKMRYYLNRPDLCEKIRHNAAELIQKEHTWTHRAKKVIDDLKKL